ncbi:quinone-dependent dihydroorotate dehydrogenase [Marinimicrobium sp. ABcell2]|uniref:quinone-dependent dihydroorotate dehydrogenase n=1 Tax=Marinimicrobium sp. ABcell2 TaxID=3069751 RepID=UPI0027B5F2DA|nr:quinone-dependent dihydroorotate dehydrogenase [Marinimicrobium sp. ABcell2]MDQ2075631.1 quinone-dependent dihydroorotate dehydrogenase [Marinimicrobium sp. ABcell2]
MYSLIRKLLFCLEPETAHDLTLDMLGAAERLKLLKLLAPRVDSQPAEVMGLQFPNPVGLAAGLDKNGDYFNALGSLGFGFVEIGTVTPKPQPGNPKPRMFRLPEREAIINRMGFNNKGVDHLVRRVERRRYQGVLGINIGKNASTPVERAVDDYLLCLDKVYDHADYITFNISSPNTPGLRDLQFGDNLSRMLEALKNEQQKRFHEFGRYVPLAVKIAPDMDDAAIEQVATVLYEQGMDGVIATNTTVSREGVEGLKHGEETGGLSGTPVQEKSTRLIATLHGHLGGRLPIIGVGGIMDGESAAEKIDAGASLVQLYTGFVYRGPALIRDAARAAELALNDRRANSTN